MASTTCTQRTKSKRPRHLHSGRHGQYGTIYAASLEEVGSALGITPQRVWQIERSALEKLRRALGVEVA